MTGDEKGTIRLGGSSMSPQEKEQYRDRINAAKGVGALKGRDVLGGVERPPMPDLKNQTATPRDEGVQPRPKGSPIIRPETQAKLEEAIRAGDEQRKVEEQKEEAKKEEDPSSLFEALDFGDLNAQIERILNNKQRREDIESRCTPMNFEDLLLRDEVRQRVPILPGKFEPTYRSITPLESLYIKRRLAKETITTDQYMGEKYNLMLLTCCLVDINGIPLPDHRGKDGEPDDGLFDGKLAMLSKKSAYIMADLSVNYVWFDIRVRKLINPDALGNG